MMLGCRFGCLFSFTLAIWITWNIHMTLAQSSYHYESYSYFTEQKYSPISLQMHFPYSYYYWRFLYSTYALGFAYLPQLNTFQTPYSCLAPSICNYLYWCHNIRVISQPSLRARFRRRAIVIIFVNLSCFLSVCLSVIEICSFFVLKFLSINELPLYYLCLTYFFLILGNSKSIRFYFIFYVFNVWPIFTNIKFSLDFMFKSNSLFTKKIKCIIP